MGNGLMRKCPSVRRTEVREQAKHMKEAANRWNILKTVKISSTWFRSSERSQSSHPQPAGLRPGLGQLQRLFCVLISLEGASRSSENSRQ